jgi:V/A-type H+/Na+-transporting ATPase subunit C
MQIEYIIIGIIAITALILFLIYPALKIIPFVYGATRIRAAKNKIISDEEFELYSQKNYKDIVYNIEKKGFSELLENLENKFAEESVQQTLRKYSSKNLKKIIKYAPRKYRRFFRKLLARKDIDLILAVLRSKINPYYSRHIIDALLVDTKYFNENELEELTKISLEEFLIRIKRTPYYDPVYNHIEEIKQGVFINIEAKLEQMYYKKLFASAKIDPALTRYVKVIISRYNIREALCFLNLNKTNYNYIPNGAIPKEIIDNIFKADSVEKVVSILNQTYYADYTKDSKSVLDIVNAMFKYNKHKSIDSFRKEPFSIQPFISFFVLKEIELKNIRILLKLKHARFESKEIIGALI